MATRTDNLGDLEARLGSREAGCRPVGHGRGMPWGVALGNDPLAA